MDHPLQAGAQKFLDLAGKGERPGEGAELVVDDGKISGDSIVNQSKDASSELANLPKEEDNEK